jgi:hypothetical protein
LNGLIRWLFGRLDLSSKMEKKWLPRVNYLDFLEGYQVDLAANARDCAVNNHHCHRWLIRMQN